MISLSAAILVACWTATLGLHSSSSTTSSYSYLALASALRRRTARSAELRPPSPLAETPPVSGPMNPTLTLSFASAPPTAKPAMSTPATARPARLRFPLMLHLPLSIWRDLRRAACRCKTARWRQLGLRHRIPARKKLWMNWRWNSRKPTSSGAEVISVAAQITDQSMP